ncbi:MAG: ABC transporter ATP-binding protein [Desulfosarcinaceae bacterium]|jgi:iron complex transport system ATP-binding protein
MSYRLKQIDFAFPGRPIFRDLDLALEAGRFHGIIGPNGCGKSTLLDLLSGFKQPDRGRISWQEVDLADQPPMSLARQIAIVPQDFHIDFPFTAEEVVAMGRYPRLARFEAPSAADHQMVAAVMARTDTDLFVERPITELSGGERQRVIFARALTQETEVLLLDEATSALDIRHSLRLLTIAAEGVRLKGLTVIAVFQDVNLAARFCHRLLFLKGGRIVAQGPPEKVLTPATLEATFGVGAAVRNDDFVAARQVAYRIESEEAASLG